MHSLPVITMQRTLATALLLGTAFAWTAAEADPYPFTKTTECGEIKVSVEKEHKIIFDFEEKKKDTCTCKKFGWIQHRANIDSDVYRYDNFVLAGTGGRTGAKSDPEKDPQPTTPPNGVELKDWDDNPWYGATSDKSQPKDFGEHPTPQTNISDEPTHPNTKFKTQLVCVETGKVFLTWEWSLRKDGDSLDKGPAKQVPPPK